MNDNPNIDIDEISILCKKFKNYILPSDIYSWLYNFNESERDLMLALLHRFNFFDDSDIIEEFYENILKLLIEFKTNNITKFYIIPSLPGNEIAKSASSMIYLFNKALKKISKIDNNSFEYNSIKYNFEFIYHSRSDVSLKNKLRKESSSINNSAIVLVDDMLGSGQQIGNFYNTFILPQLRNKNVYYYFTCIVSTFKSENYLEKKYNNIRIISTKHKVTKTFDKAKGELKKIRNICYEYGIKLTEDNKTALGYENSQLLIAFSHGAPNNTLPIFWSSKNDWKPLFPRLSKDIILKNREIKKEVQLLLGKYYGYLKGESQTFKTGKYITPWKVYSRISKTDFMIFALIKMKRRNRSHEFICNTLNLSNSSYEELIQKGKETGLFDNHGNITAFAIKEYNKISKKIKEFSQEYENVDELNSKSILYVPRSFQGIV